jgi:hypothetical protein
MNKRFLITGLITSIINLLLNAAAYFFFLKAVFDAHPPVSAAFQKQLVRPADQLIGWAMAVTSLAMGFFIATVIKWSGARNFVSGLKKGFYCCLPFLDFGQFWIICFLQSFFLGWCFCRFGM